MIVVFDVEFPDGQVAHVPLSVDVAHPLSQHLVRLQQKLGLKQVIRLKKVDGDAAVHDEGHSGIEATIRLPSGAPLEDLNTPLNQLPIKARETLLVTIEQADVAMPKLAQQFIIEGSVRSLSAKVAALDDRPIEMSGSLPKPEVQVIRLGPEGGTDAKPDDENSEDDEERLVSKRPLAADALFVTTSSDLPYSTMAKSKVSVGNVICVELPILSAMYPMQLVESVNRNVRLKSRSFNPRATSIKSTCTGIDDKTYSQLLSIAMTHGHVVCSNDELETQVALYPTISVARHSCYPSAKLSIEKKRKPYHATLVSCSAAGVSIGDEVNIAYSAADYPDFLMLPRDRRQQFMQKRYFFTCSCARCKVTELSAAERDSIQDPCPSAEQVIKMTQAARQASTTGAFFSEEASADEKKAAAEKMREDFRALGLVDESTKAQDEQENCGLLLTDAARQGKATTVEALIQYLKDFAPSISAKTTKEAMGEKVLTLHRHHWRLSFVRLALLRMYDPDPPPLTTAKIDPVREKKQALAATKASRARKAKPLDPVVFDAAIEQLAAETALMPPGHPFMLRTLALLTSSLGQVKKPEIVRLVHKRMLKKIAVDWETLNRVAVQYDANTKLKSGNVA